MASSFKTASIGVTSPRAGATESAMRRIAKAIVYDGDVRRARDKNLPAPHFASNFKKNDARHTLIRLLSTFVSSTLSAQPALFSRRGSRYTLIILLSTFYTLLSRRSHAPFRTIFCTNPAMHHRLRALRSYSPLSAHFVPGST